MSQFSDYTGLYMMHCHMLDHEDHAMMAQFKVVERALEHGPTPAGARSALATFLTGGGRRRAPTAR
jgi:hypothetical protein